METYKNLVNGVVSDFNYALDLEVQREEIQKQTRKLPKHLLQGLKDLVSIAGLEPFNAANTVLHGCGFSFETYINVSGETVIGETIENDAPQKTARGNYKSSLKNFGTIEDKTMALSVPNFSKLRGKYFTEWRVEYLSVKHSRMSLAERVAKDLEPKETKSKSSEPAKVNVDRWEQNAIAFFAGLDNPEHLKRARELAKMHSVKISIPKSA